MSDLVHINGDPEFIAIENVDQVHINGDHQPIAIENDSDLVFFYFQQLCLKKQDTFQKKLNLYHHFDVVSYTTQSPMTDTFNDFVAQKNQIISYIRSQNLRLYYQSDIYFVSDLLEKLANDTEKLFDSYNLGFIARITIDQIHHLIAAHDEINKTIDDLYEGIEYIKTSHG
jgi:hypothetical protein